MQFMHSCVGCWSDAVYQDSMVGNDGIDLSRGAWLELDLLARRRERLGLVRPQPIAVRKLLLRGTLIGASLPLVSIALCFLVLIQDRLLARQQEQLTPLANQHDAVQQSLEDIVVQIDSATARNRSIARAMADVRSSSAVLVELAGLLPREMTFESLKAEGSEMIMEGAALQPNGLRTINAFLLRLAQSSFFNSQQVRLKKAEVKESSGESNALMNFSLVAAFRNDAAAATRSRLDDLGADGLARRMRLLEEEELLK